MIEVIKFILSSFWTWLGFCLAVSIPVMYAMECIKDIAIAKITEKGYTERFLGVNKNEDE